MGDDEVALIQISDAHLPFSNQLPLNEEAHWHHSVLGCCVKPIQKGTPRWVPSSRLQVRQFDVLV